MMLKRTTFHSPRRFNLAPEAEGFVHVEFAMSCQGSENVLLQPDDFCSVPAVAWLLSALKNNNNNNKAQQLAKTECRSLKFYCGIS